jgi:hypothetical protein
MSQQGLAGGPSGGSADLDDQVVAKTGKTTAHWAKVLSRFGASSKPTSAVVDHLQEQHGVPRAWARTLVTEYLKRHG